MVQKKYSDATRDKQIGNAVRSLFILILRCAICRTNVFYDEHHIARRDS